MSMARALVSNPRLLFLDEPTSGLDPSGAVLFRKIIEQERKKGTTVFVTTHNMVDADLLCDRVAFISNGNLVALDTPKSSEREKQQSKHPFGRADFRGAVYSIYGEGAVLMWKNFISLFKKDCQ